MKGAIAATLLLTIAAMPVSADTYTFGERLDTRNTVTACRMNPEKSHRDCVKVMSMDKLVKLDNVDCDLGAEVNAQPEKCLKVLDTLRDWLLEKPERQQEQQQPVTVLRPN